MVRAVVLADLNRQTEKKRARGRDLQREMGRFLDRQESGRTGDTALGLGQC